MLAVLAVAGAGLAGCTGDGAAVDASMSVTPAAALLDVPVTVSVRGLPAGTRTTVTAQATDARGTHWSASAEFQATAAGAVSLEQPALAGSYTGANPMGLFQLMAPPASDTTHVAFEQPVSEGYDVILNADVDGKVVSTGRVHRQTPAETGVTSKELRVSGDGVYGTVFKPKDAATKRPAVLVFGGSEGGLFAGISLEASLLAAHGYPTLALAYFKAPGLPDTLTAVPLEYFTKALGVLRAQPGVDPRHVFVMGASRGGEAALLLGSYFPQLVNGVIAQVPGSYVNSAIPDRGRSAWTLAGHDVPYAGAAKFGAPAASVDPRTLIPVERIRGPVLLTCGALDLQWPSCANVDDITRRLTTRHFAYPVTALQYPDAGHFASSIPPYQSITGAALTHAGGSVPDTQNANVDVHRKLLALLAAQ
jgi:dienelactone hydrolase